jgi:hypothetical protein
MLPPYAYALGNPLNRADPAGLNATLPKGWPQPPDWKGGRGWENSPNGELKDPDGSRWHWHPDDEVVHNEHWDYHERVRQGRYKKVRLDRQGNELDDDQVFKGSLRSQSTNDIDIEGLAKEITGHKSYPVLTGIVIIGIGIAIAGGECLLEAG